MQKPLVFCLTPVKNEAWILEIPHPSVSVLPRRDKLHEHADRERCEDSVWPDYPRLAPRCSVILCLTSQQVVSQESHALHAEFRPALRESPGR
jgi:hypothetical protein